MTEEQILLVMLMEECDETSQRASKAIRFTLDEIQSGQPLTNAERIVYEFNDIVAIMEILHYKKLIPQMIDHEAISIKKAKIEKWLKYSKEIGTVKNN